MWFDYNTYEVIFTYKYDKDNTQTPDYKGYTVVKVHSHQQAKKAGFPAGVWVTSIKSRLVK